EVGGDQPYLVEDVAGTAALAREYGIPFWGIVLCVQHLQLRQVTEGELRWEVATWLAYGARGIGYFTYWTPGADSVAHFHTALVDSAGNPGPMYDVARRVNLSVSAIGETMADLRWQKTQYTGSVPPSEVPFSADTLLRGVVGRAGVSTFLDSTGTA